MEGATLEGSQIGDRYAVGSVLGRGGMAVVYAARDRDDSAVAIKVLETDSSPALEQRFEREVAIMRRLDHPNVVAVRDSGELESGQRYYVMDLLEGETLGERLDRDRLKPEEWREILEQVCAGLASAHEMGVIHRDLKPSNIFLTDALLAPGSVKLLDFGVAKIVGDPSQTKTSEVVGTPQFMAPEQARGKSEELSARTDIFSLGAIAYQMICGVRPFSGSSSPDVIHQILHAIPPPLIERSRCTKSESLAIEIALRKDPARRWSSIDEFANALRGGGDPAQLERPTDVAPTMRASEALDGGVQPRAPRAKRWLVGAGVLAAIAGAAALGREIVDRPVPLELAGVEVGEIFATGDRGLEANAAENSRAALADLTGAYRRGDRRLATRIALRHLLFGADALRATVRLDEPPTSVAVAPSGAEFAVVFASSIRRFAANGTLITTHDGSFSAARYSPDGKHLALSGAKSEIIEVASGRVVEANIGGHIFWLAKGSMVVADLGGENKQASLASRSLASRVPMVTYRCLAAGRAFVAVAQNRTGIACPTSAMILDESIFAQFREAKLQYPPTGAWLDGPGDHMLVGSGGMTHLLYADHKLESRVLTPNEVAVGAAPSGLYMSGTKDDITSIHRAEFDRGLPTVRTFDPPQARAAHFTSTDLFIRGSDSGMLVIIDPFGGLELARIPAHTGAVKLIASAGTTVVSATESEARLWSIEPRALPISAVTISDIERRFDKGYENRRSQLADNGVLVARANAESVLFDTRSGRRTQLGPEAAVLSTDGSVVAFKQTILRTDNGLLVRGIPPGEVLAVGLGGAAVAYSNPKRIIAWRKGRFETVASREERVAAMSLSASGDHYLSLVREGLSGTISVRETITDRVLIERDAEATEAFFVGDDHIALQSHRGSSMVWDWRRDVVHSESRRIERVSRDGIGIRTSSKISKFIDLDTGRHLGSATPSCTVAVDSVSAAGLAGLNCGHIGYIWDIHAERPAVKLTSRAFSLDADVEVLISASGAYAIATGLFGIYRIDLEPESRPTHEVSALEVRLNRAK